LSSSSAPSITTERHSSHYAPGPIFRVQLRITTRGVIAQHYAALPPFEASAHRS
jgi:hypothetical protein